MSEEASVQPSIEPTESNPVNSSNDEKPVKEEEMIFQPAAQRANEKNEETTEAPSSPTVHQTASPSQMTTPAPKAPTNPPEDSSNTRKLTEFERKPNLEEQHFWFANLFMCFVFPLVCKCSPLMDEDMPQCMSKNRAKPATSKFLAKFRPLFITYDPIRQEYDQRKAINPDSKEKPPKIPSLMKILLTTQASYQVALGLIFLYIYTGISVMQPFLSKGVLTAIARKDVIEQNKLPVDPEPFPFVYAILLILAPSGSALCDTLANRMIFHFSARMRSSLVGALYDKVFRIKNMASAGSADSGRILSLVSADSRIIAEMMPLFLMIFVLPVYIVVPLIFLIIDFQWIVLVALGASFVILIPNFFIISGAIGYIKEYMAHNDLRNKITNETFQGIRVVKYSGLEEVFKATINKPRFLQIASIQKMILLFQFMAAVMRTSSVIVNMSTFSVYCAVKSDDPIVFATVVMPNMGYLQMITQPTTMMPMFLQAGAMMNVNLRRLQQYLFLPEMEEVASGEDSKPSDPENALEISGGEFKWGAAPAIPMTGAETEQLKKEAEKRKKEARQAAAKRERNTTVPSDQANAEMTQVPPANPEPTSTPSELGASEYPRSDSNDTLFKQAQDASSTEGNDDASSNQTPLSNSPSPSRSSTAMSGKDGPALSDVNISIPKGSLTMIVGPVGCGKSSLGSAIVGDIEKISGTIRIDGKITYCPQTPWINNNTVRGNIVFNAEFEEEKYWNTVHVCALEPDFKIFAAGDETAIGEKGVNMSGGQKARIQLARAVYSDKDIIILDDPLSAVDAHVGRFLMDECICGVLKGKTVILMTNQLQFLDRADKVIVLETGRIIGQGTYGELKGQGINFDEFIIKSEGKKDGKQAKKKDVEVKEEEKTDEEFAKQIMTEEEQETGAISPRSYYLYFKTLMPTVLIIPFILYLAIGESVSPASQWWLGKIGSTTEYMNIDFWWKIGIYGFFGIGTFVLLFARSFMTAAMVGRSARINHQVLMDRVMDCPSSFFDTTPMGRILNRFTGDIPQVDQFLANNLIQVLTMWVGLVGQIVVIVIDTAWFLAIGIPILVLYILVLMLYARVSRNLQRLESISRSPVLSHFSETITGAGLTTIRSYGREEEWKEKFNELNDEWTTRFVLFREGQKWASLYASFISSALYTGVMIIGWFFMDAARLSVAIMSSMIFTMLGINLIQQNVELESKMTSFDRIKFYSSKLPQEAQGSEVEVPESWPPVGDVTFDAVKFKYRPGLPFVLKGVNFEIKGGEKIGVCGRTGAGKSSLLFVLFRLVELDPKLAPRMIDMKTGFPVDADPNDEPNSGRILIDGVDISKVNIHRVRRSVAIIPQDPTLFTGTVRYNMDIAGKASDDRIWEVLEMIEMRDVVASLPFGLDSQVAEGGSNFSAGQRQLLCFGRAILNNCRVVVMDEATANVDVETDAKIQRTIREQFKEQTVIVVAHRLNTIMDSTRILLMDQGYLSEFDTPENLKANPDSAFNALIQSLNN